MAILRLQVQRIEPAKSTVHHDGEAPGVLLVEYDAEAETLDPGNKYDWSNILDLSTSPPSFKHAGFANDWEIL